MDSGGDYIEKRTYVYTFRNVSSALTLCFVIAVKPYTKFLK